MNEYNLQVTVIVDVFRAFATASYVLDRYPCRYIYTTKSSVLSRLSLQYSDALFIGKNEIGADVYYHIPNSPTRVTEVNVSKRTIFHRTEAGAKGILSATGVDIILGASFVNAKATVAYIQSLCAPKVTIVPMGHEAMDPSLEDNLCAQYIHALLRHKPFDIAPFISDLQQGPGQCFFGKDQWQYPEEDFKRCLEVDRFHFAIRANLCGDYAQLTRCLVF